MAEEWIKTLMDGRKVQFVYQDLPEDGAFITAQLEGNEVVYSVVLTKAGNPLSHLNYARKSALWRCSELPLPQSFLISG
jgi:hypothetical protein